MSAARRRARKALDKCPGYEPNPMFLFLERCKHCGLNKSEHSKIQSEGSGTLFSYLGVESGIQQAKEVLSKTPVVQSYLPKDGEQAKFRVVKRSSQTAEKGQKSKEKPEETSKELSKQESGFSFSSFPASALAFFNPPSSVIDDTDEVNAKNDPSQGNEEPRKPAAEERQDEEALHRLEEEQRPQEKQSRRESSRGAKKSSIPSRKQSTSSKTPLIPKREKAAHSRPKSRTPSVRVEPPKEEELGASSGEMVRPKSFVSSRPKSLAARDNSEQPKPEQDNAASTNNSSNNNSSSNNNNNTRRSVTQFVLSKVRPVSRKSNISAISSQLQGETPADMNNSRQAHLDQIRLLMRVTDSNAFRTQMHFRRYEEPSTETLKLYKAQGGLIRWRKKMKVGWAPLHVAAWNRDDKLLRKLVRTLKSDQVDILTGDCLETALSIAVKRQALECVKVLISSGADVNMADTFGYSPLHYAVRLAGDGTFVEFLLDNGAECEAVTSEMGFTPLHLAARYGDLRICDMLLKHKVDINTLDKRGWTPLFYACLRHGKASLVDGLIDRGANIFLKDGYGLTPVHCAVVADDQDNIPPLVERGARMDVKDANGWTPVHYCARYDAPISLQTLLEFGARASPRDAFEIAPYDIAAFYKYEKVMLLLESAKGFVKPLGDRSSFNCSDSCLGVYERFDTEMDLAELANIRAVLEYSVQNNSGSCCVIL